MPVDSFSHAEYTSDTSVSVYFDAKRSGKEATIKVVLAVSSGKANDVVSAITSQVAAGNAPVIKIDDVDDVFHVKNITGVTSITTTDSPSITTGPTGATGPQGPQGETGAAGADGADGTDGADGADGSDGSDGADGQGLITGGTEGQMLVKASATDYDLEYQDRVIPLRQLAGRFSHSTINDGNMIFAGSIYGPNYQFWSTSNGTTPSGGGTVDTTTDTVARGFQHYGGIRVPVTGKVRVDVITRPADSSNSASKPYILQLWEFTADDTNSFGSTSSTLRAKHSFTSRANTGTSEVFDMTSTSDITAGNYVYITLGMDAQTLSATANQYTIIDISIIAS